MAVRHNDGLSRQHAVPNSSYRGPQRRIVQSMKIDENLVRRLVRAQFPQWASLPIRAIEHGGWDNRTFRLGDDMSIRVPSAAAYAPQIEREFHWLPMLARRLPVAIPSPIARGEPGEGLPWSWSIYRWQIGRAHV